MRRAVVTVALAIAMPIVASAVTMDMVTVGDPGNAPDPFNASAIPGIGSVDYTYQIGRFEVRNSEYAEFLNAVAVDDTFGLFDDGMTYNYGGGVLRDGTRGSYSYAAKPGYENMPVQFISFSDAARFANWLANGQPTGAQAAGTTETGSYTLFTAFIQAQWYTTGITERAADASWVIPTENEWYKAAYYDPTAVGTTNYWLYATQSDSYPNSRRPNTIDPNSANYWRNVAPYGDGVNDGYAAISSTNSYHTNNYLTDVGGYALADSYYGTFDQSGNVNEWTDTIVSNDVRILRGGSYAQSTYANSAYRVLLVESPLYVGVKGFRVALVPEPSCWLLLVIGGLALLGCRVPRRCTKDPR